jgi:hypothetical protein
VPFYEHKECYYENDGTGSFGELNCYHPKYIVAILGIREVAANRETRYKYLWYHDDLKADPRAHDPVIHCPHGTWWRDFKRVAAVEY